MTKYIVAITLAVALCRAADSYKVLPPILKGNVAIFPVVAPMSAAVDKFVSLEEGLLSGEVETESHTLLRTPPTFPDGHPFQFGPERVTITVKGSRPLLLFAGEMVVLGVVERDCVVPAGSQVNVPVHLWPDRVPFETDVVLPRNAVGEVIAIDGEFVRADVFSSQSMFRRFWPRLVWITPPERLKLAAPTVKQAERFLAGAVSVSAGPGCSAPDQSGAPRHRAAGIVP